MTQFGVDSNKLVAFADIEIPLDFVATGLILRDTINFNGATIQQPEGIGSGTLYLTAKNAFPLTSEIKLEFMLADGTRLQTITFDKPAAAGRLNAPIESVLAWEFDQTVFDKLLISDQAVITATVDSPSEATKIYSSMTLALNLSARFNYTQGGR